MVWVRLSTSKLTGPDPEGAPRLRSFELGPLAQPSATNTHKPRSVRRFTPRRLAPSDASVQVRLSLRPGRLF